jgi:hypothetical protein
MTVEQVQQIFQRCMALAERVPVEHRDELLQIASDLLNLAGAVAEKSDPQQNAPTTSRSQ